MVPNSHPESNIYRQINRERQALSDTQRGTGQSPRDQQAQAEKHRDAGEVRHPEVQVSHPESKRHRQINTEKQALPDTQRDRSVTQRPTDTGR